MSLLADWYERYVQMYKLRIVLGVSGLFFVSTVMSCEELRYMVSGKVIDATTSTKAETARRKNGEPYQRLVLGYSYHDGNDLRQRFIEVPLSWRGGPTVKVQYIPGRDRSRLLGQSNKGWVVLFVLSLAAAGAGSP